MELEALLKKPGSDMQLRDVQARSLYDLGAVGNLFGILRVGAGKTLISFLAPTVTFSERPLLLVPAKLVEKTNRDMGILMEHWDIGFIRIMTYEWLGRVQAAEALENYRPDIIIADEGHKLKNRNAAVTRRVARYFSNHDRTRFVVMSGTMTKRSLHDYSHLLKWVYDPPDYPLPQTQAERETWADALDGRKLEERRAHPGALRSFCQLPEEKKLWAVDPVRSARQAYRRHLTGTPGVIATDETPIDASLVIQSLTPDVSRDVDEAFETLRSAWETPDGWPMSDGLEMFRHARELALGFFYKWDPRPDDWWLEPRKEWCSFVRQQIKRSNTYDSELQVRRAFSSSPILAAWEAVKDDFTPNTVPVSIDDYLVELVWGWAKRNRGIVWVEHTYVGRLLSEKLGLSYYGRKGLDATGRMVEEHPAGEAMLCSVASNAEGRNLQAWNRNLVLSPPPNGQQWEQLLGRTHRDGQEADEVFVDVLMTCREHVHAFAQAQKDAEYARDVTGSPQKLLLADVSVKSPLDLKTETRARWL